MCRPTVHRVALTILSRGELCALRRPFRKQEAERKEPERIAGLEGQVDRLLDEALALGRANKLRSYVSTVHTASTRLPATRHP